MNKIKHRMKGLYGNNANKIPGIPPTQSQSGQKKWFTKRHLRNIFKPKQ